MPSKLDYAINHFEKGLSILQNLLDDKEKIKEGLITHFSLLKQDEGNKTILVFFIGKFYEFLEDDFGPQIKAIEKQIDEGKLSKGKYNLLINDVYNGDAIDIFELQFSPIYKLLVTNQDKEKNSSSEIKNALSEFYILHRNVRNLSYLIEPIHNIIKYGTENEDSEYFYFSWYENDKEDPLENKDKEKNNITSPYDYYDKISEKEAKKEVEKKNINILKNLQLLSKDGKDSITVKKKEKLLCELIFSDGYLRDGFFNFLTIEREIYDGERQNKDTIEGLIKRVKAKLIKLGYPKNIFEVTDETLIIKKTL